MSFEVWWKMKWISRTTFHCNKVEFRCFHVTFFHFFFFVSFIFSFILFREQFLRLWNGCRVRSTLYIKSRSWSERYSKIFTFKCYLGSCRNHGKRNDKKKRQLPSERKKNSEILDVCKYRNRAMSSHELGLQ